MARISSTLLTVVMLLVARIALGQVVDVDRTGSMRDQKTIESAAAVALASVEPVLTAMKICFIGPSALSPTCKRVVAKDLPPRSSIKWVNEKRLEIARKELEPQIVMAFTEPFPPLTDATDLAAIATRAIMDAPALVISDNKHEAGWIDRAVGSGVNVFVVQCPAIGDRATRELKTFEARKTMFLKLLPKARVYSCGDLSTAVNDWAAAVVAADQGLMRVRQER